MFVARWQIDARFGQKQKVIDLVRAWERDIGSKAGIGKMKIQLLTGSIGAREATVEIDHTVETLAELEQMFEKLGEARCPQAVGAGSGTLRGLRFLALADLPRAVDASIICTAAS